MKKIVLVLFSFLPGSFIVIHAQQTSSQPLVTAWGNYITTSLPAYGPTVLQVRMEGENAVWNGIFTVNSVNSYTASLHWNSVRMLSYASYNSSKDDVQVLIMSNSPTNAYGPTQIVIKLGTPVSGPGNLYVTVLGGEAPASLSLINSATAPFSYTMATSEGSLGVWTVDNKVGVGTASPKSSLDLVHLRLGSISEFPSEGSISETNWPNYVIGNAESQRIRLGLVNDGYTRSEIELDNSNRSDGTIVFKTADGVGGAMPRMFIHGNGHVGIGTGATDMTVFDLAVNGTIGSRKVKVTQSGWPDYVFADDYKILSLEEVEAFIKKNRHLPAVPPAEEIERNGLDLGDNQAVLLRKIEELTLYLIEQDKKIKAQEKEIEQLKKVKCW